MINLKQKSNIIQTAIMIVMGMLFFTYTAYASEISVSNVIKLANDAREEEGISALEENKTLDKIAADKLDDMIKNNYFAHTSPQGKNPWYWFEKEKYDYKYAGENLAINFLVAEDQQKAWMASPTHRKNIMNPNYQEIGVAVGAGEINGQTSIIAVQEFGTLVGAGNASVPGKNFSSENNKNVLKEMGAKPQVLSVKDFTEDSLKNNPSSVPGKTGFFDSFMKWMLTDRYTWSGYSWMLAFFLLMFSLFFSSVAFISVAGHEMLAYEEIRKKALESALDINSRRKIMAQR